MQIRRFRGRRTVMSFRLCSRAPWTTRASAAMKSLPLYRANVRSSRAGSARQPLYESAELTRMGHAGDLQVAGDDRPVAEQAADQRLLELDGAHLCKPHRSGLLSQHAVDDEQLLGRHDDARAVPAPDGDEGHH